MEIKPHELRIGNIISFKGLWEGEVEGITKACIDIKDNGGVFPHEVFQPVLLTPEWLVNLGFYLHQTKTVVVVSWSDTPMVENTYISHVLAPSVIHNTELNRFMCNKRIIEYVHQLQNVYFWQCNKELIWNKKEILK